MAELWIPNLNKTPDLENVYDMMAVFQESLYRHDELLGAVTDARIAVRSINSLLDRMNKDKKDVTVAARKAILESTEKPGLRLLCDDVGVNGTILEARAEPLDLDGKGRYYLTLQMDVMTMFPLAEPDMGDYMLRQGSVPIAKVDYIETAA